MPCAGFRADATEVAQRYDTVTASNGTWSATLERNSNITPAGTYYEVEERIPASRGGSKVWQFVVGATNQTLAAAAVSVVPDLSLSSYLTQAAADLRYQQLSAYGTVSDIADSRPGDAGAAGTALSAARSDHKHDRETQRGTAATIAALTGTDLIVGYPYVTSDANNITGTGIQTPDTTSQPARTDSLFVKNAQRFQPGFWNQPWGVMGYVEITGDVTFTTLANITGLSLTFTAAANRRIKITAFSYRIHNATTDNESAFIYIRESTTKLQTALVSEGLKTSLGGGNPANISCVISPTAGSHTYVVSAERAVGANTHVYSAASTAPAFLLIEDIGPNGAPA